MTTEIHPTAIIADSAKIGDKVTIGPYSIVGPDVVIGDGTALKSHVVIEGRTIIGKDNVFYPFCSIGSAPQDLKFGGELSTVTIGDRNVIREYVTINPGTIGGAMNTAIGNDCLLMISSHIAHDCKVGNRVILANNVALAGHVTVGDFAVIGGMSAVHQFVRIGAHAMIGGMSGVEHDVIPFGVVMGERASLAGINIVGMKRRDFAREDIHQLRHLYKILFEVDSNESLQQRLIQASSNPDLKAKTVKDVLNFIAGETSRALCVPKK